MPLAADDPASIVRAHLDAFNEGDLSSLLETLAADAFFMTGTTVVNPVEFPNFFGGASTRFAPRMQYGEMLTAGNEVACQLLEEVTIDDQRRKYPKAAFYRIEQGRIAWAKVYWEGDPDD